MVKTHMDNSSYYVFRIPKLLCVLFITVYAVVILPSCSNDSKGQSIDPLEGSWQFFYVQAIRTYNGKPVGDIFD